MKELDILAVKENLPEVLAFIDSQLEELNCGIKIITQVDVAVEEILSIFQVMHTILKQDQLLSELVLQKNRFLLSSVLLITESSMTHLPNLTRM